MSDRPLSGRDFRTTCWTEVMSAVGNGLVDATDAFGQLYSDYRRPIYAFVRQRGYAEEEAEDITQDFFLRLMEKQALKNLEREGGRFRSFLLGALRNFLANEWDHRHAKKRGGGVRPLSLDSADEEGEYLTLEVTDDITPETLYEKSWVLTLLNHVADRLRGQWPSGEKQALFDDLRPHLQCDRAGLPYAEIAAKHGLTESAVKVSVHRLRQRYGIMLREEIARTVSNDADIDEELQYLIRVISG